MLHFAADRRFAVFKIPLPVNCVVGNMSQMPGTAVDSEVNPGIVLVVCNLRTFLDAEVTRIAVDHLVILSKQCCSLGNVVLIGCGNPNRVNQSAAGIYTDVALHAELSLVPFLCLMHFGVTSLFGVLCGAWRVDYGRIYNRAALHHVACLYHDPVDCLEK